MAASSTLSITTACNPIGSGRSGDRAANTSLRNRFVSPRGYTESTSRHPRCILSSAAEVQINPRNTDLTTGALSARRGTYSDRIENVHLGLYKLGQRLIRR